VYELFSDNFHVCINYFLTNVSSAVSREEASKFFLVFLVFLVLHMAQRPAAAQAHPTGGNAEVQYKPLDPTEILTDQTQRRSTYLGVKRFINEELKRSDLSGKRLAVLEAVKACCEQGLTSQQCEVFQINKLDTMSYDRLCIILCNILSSAGENYAENGPYTVLVKETFSALEPEVSESSTEREKAMLTELRDLRASVERVAKPATKQRSRGTPPAPKPSRSLRKTHRGDDEDDDDNDDDDDSDATNGAGNDGMDWHDGAGSSVSSVASARSFPILQPKILLDGKNWHHLQGETWGDVKRAVLDHYSAAKDKFPHDISFVMDMLCAFFGAVQTLPSSPPARPLVLGIDRAIARLEYFQKRATSGDAKTAGAKAAHLEARLIERDLPDHIRRSRKEVEKRSF
jgi:hypothetical protein